MTRQHRFAALGVALLLAAVTPAAANARYYVYHWMQNIPADGQRVGERHNHYYHEMITNRQALLTHIREETYCCGWKWVVNGVGTISYSHASTWYALALCRNRDYFSYWVEWCAAEY